MEHIDEAYIVNHFPKALESGFIQAYYQPIHRSVTGEMICAEALARWHDPEHGILSPVDYIPVLERGGLIFQLDMEMIRQTCAFYCHLLNRGTPLHAFTVNLSRHDFRHEALFETVTGILEAHGVPC